MIQGTAAASSAPSTSDTSNVVTACLSCPPQLYSLPHISIITPLCLETFREIFIMIDPVNIKSKLYHMSYVFMRASMYLVWHVKYLKKNIDCRVNLHVSVGDPGEMLLS